MTKPNTVEAISAFCKTELGRLFTRFETAHSRAWQADAMDGVSPKRLRELGDTANNCRVDFLTALLSENEKLRANEARLEKENTYLRGIVQHNPDWTRSPSSCATS